MKKIILILMVVLLNLSCSGDEKRKLPASRAAYLLHRVETSSIEFNKSLDSLQQAKQLHTVPKIKETIRRIEDVEKKLSAAVNDVDLFKTFLKKNERKLRDSNRAHYLDLKPLMGKYLTIERRYASQYIKDFKEWQHYSLNNFDQIKRRNPGCMRKYDVLIMKYEKSLKKFKTARNKDIKFINAYLASNADLVKKFQEDYKLMKAELGWR